MLTETAFCPHLLSIFDWFELLSEPKELSETTFIDDWIHDICMIQKSKK